MNYEKSLIYRLWLSCVCRHSPPLIDKCLRLGYTPEELFHGAADDRIRDILRDYNKEYRRKDLSDAEKLLEYCMRNNIRVLSIDDKAYPETLRNIDTPPGILYTKGEELDLNDYFTITVVGSRYVSDDMVEFTRKLGYELAASGMIVVSGMALSLDAAAHTGALVAGQKTVAVLAGGVNVVYPPENRYLYDQILESGMIVSERPPEMKGNAELYDERNRIVAGLSYGTIVVRGNKRSGTKKTARHAFSNSRDVFAVPGSPLDPMSYVPNMLLSTNALVATSAEDVLREYETVYADKLERGRALLTYEPAPYEDMGDVLREVLSGINDKSRTSTPKKEGSAPNGGKTRKKPQKPDFSRYSEDERRILEYLYSSRRRKHIDEIMRDTGMNPANLQGIMLMLQVKGAVKQSMGNLYELSI